MFIFLLYSISQPFIKDKQQVIDTARQSIKKARPSRWIVIVIIAIENLLFAPIVLSQTNPLLALNDLFELDLEALGNIVVVSATGRPLTIPEAPAIISIISKEDIYFWQYQSVGEALQQIPGFYCINDLISYNCGIRGINGGLRAYSRIMKVMINGQSVAYRSDSTNFLGPELLPMGIIEKIEVIRGPVSALYGADAFLGVINIITKEQKDPGYRSQLNITANKMDAKVGYTVSAQTFGRLEYSSYSLAFSTSNIDRSGLELPDTIPTNAAISKPKLIPGSKSENDISRPSNLYGQFRYQRNQHDIKVSGYFSRLDSHGEFLDFGELSHNNRLSLDSGFMRVEDNWLYNSSLTIKAALANSKGNPSNKEQLSFGDANTYPKRDFGFSATDFLLEFLYTINDSNQLTFGFDDSKNKETLIDIFNVDRVTGKKTQVTTESGDITFVKKGYYLQYLGNFDDDLSLTLNVRSDTHSIYGNETSYRSGLVFKFSPDISSKLLFGTAYKAPAAMQLFGHPLFSGEIEGNANLKPEKVTTLEYAMAWHVSDSTLYEFNVYQSKLKDKVELVSGSATNVTPKNRGAQESEGVETEFRWQNSKHTLRLNAAYQKTSVNSFNILSRKIVSDSALYPKLMGNIYWLYTLTPKARLALHWRYVSERRASDDNIDLNNVQAYSLAAYNITNVTLTWRWDNMGFSAKINNLFDTRYAEPGFGGLDFPGATRTIFLGVSYDL